VHLKSLTLKGFKSFAAATTLAFEPGITCVVGPNGSGKSNVVDGLAWVMGEQGAKSLRGGAMSDVIFAGTSGRAPLGRAEVALTIDNSDGALPIDYTEVTISRTLFRNGGSEYAINGDPCRLLDVQELLSDSGIGREMHVIVGQGQLDAILHATPEDRRGFVEEAAGVLKHRKRKEKALRKLDAMEANLARVGDLANELRRQLKPLGKQAEVARRAAVIQAEARDARLRLLADDLGSLRETLAAEVADEAALRQRRMEVEALLAGLTSQEADLERDLQRDAPLLATATQSWFALLALRERLLGTGSLAAERLRLISADEQVVQSGGRDPQELEAQAREVRAEEFEWGRRVEGDRAALADAVQQRQAAEDALAAEESRITAESRAAADRRESLARLGGQVAAARSRWEARGEQVQRLSEQHAEALARAEVAQREFTALESQVAGLDAGEVGLDAEYESVQERLLAADANVESLRESERDADRERAALSARCEALRIGLAHGEGVDALVAEGDRIGVIGTVTEAVRVEPGAERAVAALLGPLAEAVIVSDERFAHEALVFLREHDAGRATIVIATDAPTSTAHASAPPESVWMIDTLSAAPAVLTALRSVLDGAVLVADLSTARRVRSLRSDLTVVTRDGDVFGPRAVRGGSRGAPTLLEVQAAVDEAESSLAEVTQRLERTRFSLAAAIDEQRDIAELAESALTRLHDSDARLAAVAEQLGQWGAEARSAAAEAERLGQSIADAQAAREADEATLSELQQRFEAAQVEPTTQVADEREVLAQAAEAARRTEVDARLAVRTGEERIRSLSSHAQSLERSAANERAARRRAEELRERRRREAISAQAVAIGVRRTMRLLDAALSVAETERDELQRSQSEREASLHQVRDSAREQATQLERLTDSVHRDEVARAEQRLRIEQLEGRVIEEFGLEPDVVVAEYGPEQLVPPAPLAPGDDEPDEPAQPYPYVRVEQERRLASAERGLALLGRVNPLALEEYAALEERLRFLTEQLDDLKRSRTDLQALIADVDERIQQVFAEAYADTERHFADVFSRLFPGGDGRLVLTEPDDLLTTGIDVEARPPGKKVKRLSLLSGGERSLTAVAFLIALFKARPSPFYVLDEVEAALDDVNLGRLIAAIEELRDTSQLIIITHQKRTMEIADALYGVSMRGDGVTHVVGQRLRDTEAATA
jgi:chromosome segregation protein